jgi:glucose/arabinose dehydrogenase
MDPIRLNDGRNGNGNDGFGGQQTTLQSLNNSADLLLSLSAYNLHQVQQQQQQQQLLLQQQQQSQQQNTQFQLIPQQQQQPPTTQFQLIPQQQQQQAFLPFTFPANTMAVTSNSGTASPPNSGSVGHSYPDRERQIKRRTKTGLSIYGAR